MTLRTTPKIALNEVPFWKRKGGVALPGLGIAILLVSVLASSTEVANPEAVKLSSKVIPIGFLPMLAERTNLVVSADNTKAACRVRHGWNWTVWNAGKESAEYKRVEAIAFSPDGRHFAFGAQKESGEFVICLDGQETNTCGLVRHIRFSRDSLRLAYFDARIPPGTNMGKAFLVLDGKKGPEFETVSPTEFGFSPDSQRFAYRVGRFSRDPTRPAYHARGLQTPVRINDLVVVDELKSQEYDNIYAGTLTFSPDSGHIVFAAQRNGKSYVVLDQKEGKSFEAICIPSIRFSPIGKQLAFVAKGNSKWTAVVVGSDGKHEPLTGETSRGHKELSAHESFSAVLNDLEKEGFNHAQDGWLSFSPNTRRFAYVAPDPGRRRLIIDGLRAGEHFDNISPVQPLFSQDSTRVAWMASRGGKEVVAEIGQEGKGYDNLFVESLAFSPDSKHLAYIAVTGRRFVIVIDGVESATYEDLWPKLVFTDSERVRAVGLQFDDAFREQLVRIELEIASTQTP